LPSRLGTSGLATARRYAAVVGRTGGGEAVRCCQRAERRMAR
jgi:hypothetical protein